MGRPPIGDRALTAAERQARRREQFRRMKDALEQIRDEARTVREARAIATAALSSDIEVQE